ncbi:MAG: hypothetical protein ACRDPW_02360 [Mycobacteriales bacterium]
MIQAGYPPKSIQEILGHAGPLRPPVPRRSGPLGGHARRRCRAGSCGQIAARQRRRPRR